MLKVSAHCRRVMENGEWGEGIASNNDKQDERQRRRIAGHRVQAEGEEEWKVQTMWRISATPSL